MLTCAETYRDRLTTANGRFSPFPQDRLGAAAVRPSVPKKLPGSSYPIAGIRPMQNLHKIFVKTWRAKCRVGAYRRRFQGGQGRI